MARFVRILLLLALVTPLAGCYCAAGTGKAPWKKHAAQFDPPIRGQWSEPVNGVRMMAIPLASSSTMPGRRIVLLYSENMADAPVSLPTIRPVGQVTPRSERGAEPFFSNHTNLRLEYELIGTRQVPHHIEFLQQQERLEELTLPLMPGEIRVSAVQLNMRGMQMKHALEQLLQNEVPLSEVSWSLGLDERAPARLYLTFRPEGFDPKRKQDLRNHEQWHGKQIELPPLEIMVRPERNQGSTQELNG